MDVKIYKNYIQNHQNWDHKYTLDVEKCTIYDGCKKIKYTLDVEKCTIYSYGCKKYIYIYIYITFKITKIVLCLTP
jgi:hypothetical protein